MVSSPKKGRFESSADEYEDDEFAAEAGGPDEMDAMMDQYLDRMGDEHGSGRLIEAPVVGVKDGQVLLDVGDKSEGVFDLREYTGGRADAPLPRPGEVLEVVVRGTDSATGLTLLSYAEARRRRAADTIRAAMAADAPLSGVIQRVVKGGVIVDLGASGFMPASLVDVRRVVNLDEWVGREVEFLVLEFAPEKNRVVISRRGLLERREAARKEEIFGRFKPGDVLEGKVRRVVDFGAFVDLGGVDGLVPRSELSWNRTANPREVLEVGQTVQVQVVDLDRDAGKITLSRRRLLPDPWAGAVEKYPVGSVIEGDIVSVTSYGAFVRLEEGLDGLVHVSDMSWDASGRKPQSFASVGQRVQAVVLAVDPDARRISLGLKQLSNDPWVDFTQRVGEGSRVKGRVTGITKYGAFVELEPGVEGMVHVSDFSWDKRINHPRDIVAKDQEVEALVLKVDLENRRISLGMKQLRESPMQLFVGKHRVGQAIEGVVRNVAEFGVFVELDEGVEGFVHVSQLDQEKVDKPSSLFKPGDSITAEITKIDHDQNRVSLNRKTYLRKRERQEMAPYLKAEFKGGTNLGELLSEIFEPEPEPEPAPEPEAAPEASAPVAEAPAPAPEPSPAPEPVAAGETKSAE